MYVCVRVPAEVDEGTDPPELQFCVVVSPLVWVLGTKLGIIAHTVQYIINC